VSTDRTSRLAEDTVSNSTGHIDAVAARQNRHLVLVLAAFRVELRLDVEEEQHIDLDQSAQSPHLG